MSEQASPQDRSARQAEPASGWAVGFSWFAASMLLMVGVLQVLAGLVAIFENEIYVQTRSYLLALDVTVWGWIHLLLGVIVALAGWGLLSGRSWARVVGVTLAVLSVVANFLFLAYYPLWSLLIIAVDVLVIWVLAAHGQQARDAGS